MGLFDKIKEPIFLKEESSLTSQLDLLEGLLKSAPADSAKKIEQEIRNVKAGLTGEQQIAFELKNSHIPMYVLHDLYLEFEGLTVQIDYLVLTRRRIFVIESKNLYGNIEITSQGDFIRKINYGNKFYKERIYSPITQNERHLALIKKIRAAECTNILTQALFEKNFSNNYRSVVVLANPKTVLNDKYAKKEMKEQVIPIDRLITHIKTVNLEKGADDRSEKDLTALAHYFLQIDRPKPDYTERYRQMFQSDRGEEGETAELPPAGESVPDVNVPEEVEESCDSNQILCPRCGAPMILRTAVKGENAGNTFYGCSHFPKCRGIINLKQQEV